MRVATLLNRLLDLPGVGVSGVAWQGQQLVIGVRLRSRMLACAEPGCGYLVRAR